jgi:hypothetical protein
LPRSSPATLEKMKPQLKRGIMAGANIKAKGVQSVDIAAQPGRGIGRDIGRGEAVERELDAFISKRHEQRVKTEGERQIEESWRESERREEARRREVNRGGWLSWYRRLERGYLERAAECGRSADALERSVDNDERKSA